MDQPGQASGSSPSTIPSLVVDPRWGVSLQTLLEQKERMSHAFYNQFNQHFAIRSLPVHRTRRRLANAIIALRQGVKGNMLKNLVTETDRYVRNKCKKISKRLHVEQKWREYLEENSDELGEQGKVQDLDQYANPRRQKQRGGRKKKTFSVDPNAVDAQNQTLLSLVNEKPGKEEDQIKWLLRLTVHPTIQSLIQTVRKELPGAIAHVARKQHGLSAEDQIDFRNEITAQLASMTGCSHEELYRLVVEAWSKTVNTEINLKKYWNLRDHQDPRVSEMRRRQDSIRNRLRYQARKEEWDPTYLSGRIKKEIQEIPAIEEESVSESGPETEPEPEKKEKGFAHAPFSSFRPFRAARSKPSEHRAGSSSQRIEPLTSSRARPLHIPNYSPNIYYGTPPGFEGPPQYPAGNVHGHHTDDFTDFLVDRSHLDDQQRVASDHAYTQPPVDPTSWYHGIGRPQAGYYKPNQSDQDSYDHHYGSFSALAPYSLPRDQFSQVPPYYYHNYPSHDGMNEPWSAPTYYPSSPSSPPTDLFFRGSDSFGGGSFQ